MRSIISYCSQKHTTPEWIHIAILNLCISMAQSHLVQFIVIEDIPLVDIKSNLNNLMWYLDNQKIVKLNYRSPSFDVEEKIQFKKFKLKINDDLRFIWSTFYRYEINCLVEVNVIISRSTENILKMLKRHESSTRNEM